jgi:hypothetical protein
MNSSIQAEPDSRKSFVFSYGEIVFFFVLIAITKISRTELTIGRIYDLIGPFSYVSPEFEEFIINLEDSDQNETDYYDDSDG